MAQLNLIKLKIVIFTVPLFCNQFFGETMTIRFTNLICKTYDKSFTEFKKCELKAMGRDKISAYVHWNLYQLPLDNLTINAGYFIRSSSQRYQPFLYNTTVDFCKFIRNQNSLPFWKIFMSMLVPYSNVNHSCPYNHDIIVDNFILEPSMFKKLPFPTGEYMITMRIAAYNVYRAEVRGYIQLKE